MYLFYIASFFDITLRFDKKKNKFILFCARFALTLHRFAL